MYQTNYLILGLPSLWLSCLKNALDIGEIGNHLSLRCWNKLRCDWNPSANQWKYWRHSRVSAVQNQQTITGGQVFYWQKPDGFQRMTLLLDAFVETSVVILPDSIFQTSCPQVAFPTDFVADAFASSCTGSSEAWQGDWRQEQQDLQDSPKLIYRPMTA